MRMDSNELDGVVISARASAAVEIDWALSGAHRSNRVQHPALSDFYSAHPDLTERVQDLWGPEESLSYPSYLELSSLAHGSGFLFMSEPEALVSQLEQMCRDAPVDLPFAAETPRDGAAFRRRLLLLRTDKAFRRRYVEVVSDLWAEVRGLWELEGRGAVQAAIGECRAYLKRGSDPTELVLKHLDQVNCTNIGTDQVTRLIDGIGVGGEIVLVPAFFGVKGLIADLPGTLIVGTSARPVAATSRARTEDLARRLKAIADPTRLAILDALARGQMTIGDVTAQFGLAQPTVSNHIKQLRDAGVVTSTADGRRRELTVRREVFDEIVSALDEVFDIEDSRGRRT
jgi:DNA-binding transcriptional ArsR family regulator